MGELVIRAEAIGKRYRITGRTEAYGTLRDAIVRSVRAPLGAMRGAPPREFWALRDVSFDVRRGEVLGIIGHNGAGKSTLLKILARVTRPSAGRAEIDGRVGSLLEVGTGFHAELTGRENIYLNGAVLGMTRAEIRRRFDEIVQFAEIADFLDVPVKRYSSGMYMRLAFSIAAHLEPDILIVDEVLAVGDAAFQKRCLGKMQGMTREAGRTVLFVSHNLQAVQALCGRALLLAGGRVVFDGEVHDAVGRYLANIKDNTRQPLDDHAERGGNGSVRIQRIGTRDGCGTHTQDFVAGEPLVFEFEYVRNEPCAGVNLGLTVYNQLGTACTHLNTDTVDYRFVDLGDHGRIQCRIARNPFPVGEYYVSALITTDDGMADYVPGCAAFRIVGSRFFGTTKAAEPDLQYCPVMVDHSWSHTRLCN